MHLEGLAQFEKNRVLTEVGEKGEEMRRVLTEIPPEKDEKGEVTEVQVLEEGELPDGFHVAVFDPDEFLEKLEQFQPQCSRCKVPMKFGEVEQTNGNLWKFYRCPTNSWGTKCYVTCHVDEVGDYLRRVERQTHPCYKNIDHARFRCDCNLSLVLATSHSVNNPDRLYLKCSTRSCKFFQWINRPPSGLAKNILIDKDRIAELYK